MKYIYTLLIGVLTALTSQAQTSIPLDGDWTVRLGNSLDELQISLPGTLDDAAIGTPNTLEPELTKPQLSRLTRKHSFIGTATYQRDINIPKEMARQPLELVLERVMWRSRLLIDGQDIGQMQESLVSPHVFNIEGLTEGRHTLSLIIDNTKLHDISHDNLAHSYTNDTQIMWNGVLGQMQLRLAPTVTDLQVYPDIERQLLRIHVSATEPTFILNGMEVEPKVNDNENDDHKEYLLPISNMKLWSEFSPTLYTLTVISKGQSESVTFGMRSFSTEGNQLLINGHPTFLRGTLACCIFPLTGTPPTDERGWTKVFSTAREYGLNHLRFHSWYNMHELVDVVSFNQYVGWYRDVNDAPKMQWDIPYDKPVIVSEFGGGAKYGYHGGTNLRWTEEFQENLYRENLAMLDKIDGLAGTTPWILKDFRSPRRVLSGIQDFFNMKGLLSDKGERKKAWYVLKEWYESK